MKQLFEQKAKDFVTKIFLIENENKRLKETVN